MRTETVRFEAGPSILGSEEADADACLADPRSDENCDEVPLREITLDAFSMDIHEVTNEQYAACMDAGRCTPPGQREAFDDPTTARHPVTWVNQVQASIYCQWALGRLPTEAQWERAARGDRPLEVRRFPWGDDAPEPCIDTNLGACEGIRPVGSFMGDTTSDGIMDMIGNVHEMVDGWYDPLYYRRAPETNPRGAERPGDMSLVPVRGGSYAERASFATISYRGFRILMTHRAGRPSVGFRCAHD